MSVLLPKYPEYLINYRIPDNSVTPNISRIDYFITASFKNFMFKDSDTDKINYLKIDFLSINNSFNINNNFTTI
jgi:hypothetical protein